MQNYRDTAKAMNELLEVKIGVGSISAIQKRISSALAVPVAQVQQFVEQQAVIDVDGTS